MQKLICIFELASVTALTPSEGLATLDGCFYIKYHEGVFSLQGQSKGE